MPRKSTAALAIAPVIDARQKRIRPPADLGTDEARLFREIAASCDASHFVASDAPLLTAFCTAVLLSRAAAAEGDLAAWEKATKMLAMLATRLRLAPQARADPKTIARRHAALPTGTPPWEN